MPRNRKNNRKRRIRRPNVEPAILRFVADRVRYIGSQYHKRSPGNFELPLPMMSLPQKSLCDDVRLFDIREAQALLEAGVALGLGSWPDDVKPSTQFPECPEFPGFPDLVWSIRNADGQLFEAQLHNSEQGHYHGYPIYSDDAVYNEVMRALEGLARE